MGCSFSNLKMRCVRCQKCHIHFRSDGHLHLCDHCFSVLSIEEKLDIINSVSFLNKEFEEDRKSSLESMVHTNLRIDDS